jgi:hypothetical protein
MRQNSFLRSTMLFQGEKRFYSHPSSAATVFLTGAKPVKFSGLCRAKKIEHGLNSLRDDFLASRIKFHAAGKKDCSLASRLK